MNSVQLIGNLVRSAELRYTPQGKSVTNFTIAVSDKFNKNNAYYFDIVVWGKLAELCAEWLDKGKKVAITGRLTSRTYETQEGQKRKVVEVVADEVDFLTPKSGNANTPSKPPADDGWNDVGQEVPAGDDDIPF